MSGRDFGRRVRFLAVRLALAALSLLLAVTVLEAGLQWLHRDEGYARSPGPNSVYEIRLGEFRTEVRTNSLNMREEEIHSRTPGEERVVFLGDSFTFGLGVESAESFPELLPSLVERAGRRIYAINAGGRGGYAGQQHEFLRRNEDVLDPDMLVAQVYIGNDFVDATIGPVPDPAAGDPYAQGGVRGLVRDNRIYTLEMLWNTLIAVDAIDDLLLRWNLRYSERSIFLKDYPPLETWLASEVLRGLGDLHAVAIRRAIPIIVVLVPTKVQVFKQHAFDERYDLTKPNRILREFCAEHDLPVLDLLEVYDRLPEGQAKSFYYVRDLHWNVSGQRHAAETLAEFLVRLPLGFARAAPAPAPAISTGGSSVGGR